MDLSHAKLVLESILEGCQDVDLVKELIDTAWRLTKDGTKPPPEPEIKPRKPGTLSGVRVNDRTFRSTKAACKFYGMEVQYSTVLADLRSGVHPEDIFPKEPPKPKTRRPIDQATGLVI